MGRFNCCFVFVFLWLSELFTCINLRYFSVKMLIILSLASFKNRRKMYPFPFRLGAPAQALEPVELHKLTNDINQRGFSFFFCLVENYPFLKTEQWHNCSLCSPVQDGTLHGKARGTWPLTQCASVLRRGSWGSRPQHRVCARLSASSAKAGNSDAVLVRN